ncbi:hypothetical protein [Pelotomaculum sp. PtaB.Bin117]|uniref:hypothetical protein n=1 Tax=Pelotomaculum sp. PtaB.Bin117 TaxID=1811694 RepID=UPI0009CCDD1F|nr:hypothetical protein [Pelotomaculum sp. PtaB.Bin117]OPX88156.1 MAG: hypothetical protein A4E54_01380 [Pelotomaculum sp. PtaB.Bin117]
MNVLIIDDQPISVKGIEDFCAEKNWEVTTIDFDNVYQQIIEKEPDIIILDWRQDADHIDVGDEILTKIWTNCFRPIIIFSANAAVISIAEKLQKSTLLRVFSKGDETPVTDYLCKTESFVVALSDYRKEMSNAMIEALNAVQILRSEGYPGNSVFKYILSKRTATFFDIQYSGELPPAWVQYVYPPVVTSLCACDIIRVIAPETDYNSEGNPEEYRIILTPSCDMVPARPKVTHALCASCYPKEKFHNCVLSDNPKSKNISSVQSDLNRGYNECWVALPGIKSILPYMTVDLKKIELVDLSKIALSMSEKNEDTEFVRIASVDSPFREQIIWAHMQNACRPGVPDRNTEPWAKELLTG